MRITGSQLRQIIRETLENDDDDESYGFLGFGSKPSWMPDIPEGVMTTVSSNPIAGIRDTSRQCGYGRKPRGLWYAPGTAWIDWMQSEMPSWLAAVNHVYTVQPIYAQGGLNSRGGVLQLQTPRAMRDFSRRFAVEGGREINWPEVTDFWDGIEIIPSQYDMTGDMTMLWYWGWDIPSGCIWRPSGVTEFKLLASKP